MIFAGLGFQKREVRYEMKRISRAVQSVKWTEQTVRQEGNNSFPYPWADTPLYPTQSSIVWSLTSLASTWLPLTTNLAERLWLGFLCLPWWWPSSCPPWSFLLLWRRNPPPMPSPKLDVPQTPSKSRLKCFCYINTYIHSSMFVRPPSLSLTGAEKRDKTSRPHLNSRRRCQDGKSAPPAGPKI